MAGFIAIVVAKEAGTPAKVDYSSVENPPNIGPGKDFTLRQKQEALELNKAANGGLVKSDANGIELVQPQNSQRGVTPAPNEWQFDQASSQWRIVISVGKGSQKRSTSLGSRTSVVEPRTESSRLGE